MKILVNNSSLLKPLSCTEKYLEIDVDNLRVAVTTSKLVKIEKISIIHNLLRKIFLCRLVIIKIQPND